LLAPPENSACAAAHEFCYDEGTFARRAERWIFWKDQAMNKAKILPEALKLPPVDRAEVVETLLTSFEFAPRAAIDALWVREAEDRIDAYERGEIPAVPAEDVFAKVWSWCLV
jgi:putative addiction module component (TIGR02574 family)